MAPTEAVDALLEVLAAKAGGISCEVQLTGGGALLVLVRDPAKLTLVRRAVPTLVEGFPTRVISSLDATLARRPAPHELAAHLRALADSLDSKEDADAAA